MSNDYTVKTTQEVSDDQGPISRRTTEWFRNSIYVANTMAVTLGLAEDKAIEAWAEDKAGK